MARTLKVVFQADVRGIAQAGDVKTVSPGYARNYLYPRKLAFPATEAALRQWETVRQGTLAKAARQREDAQSVAQRIESVTCTISAKASPEGKLFGSVGRQEILDALSKQGLTLDKQSVVLPKPIKQLGATTVVVHLAAGVQAKLAVNVTPENS
jgi:large subunit ribosomal protein L9